MTLSLTDKQQELITAFEGMIEHYHITIKINEPLPSRDVFSVDVEHDEHGGFVGVGFYSLCDNTVYYFSDLHAINCDVVLSVSLIAHNGISDFECLRQWGIPVTDEQLVWDTYLIGHIRDSSLKAYGLKDMAKRELGIEYPSYDDIVGKRTAKQKAERVTLDKQPIELVAAYNAMDCFVTGKIAERHGHDDVSYFKGLEKPVSKVFYAMEARGVRVDLQYLHLLRVDLERKKLPLEQEIKNELGAINLNSPKQLIEALHAKEIYPELKGKASTDKRAISQYSHIPVVDKLLRYSEIDTLLSSFVTPYLERGTEVVHPFFNQCGTRTGRPSCSNPNLLQIPRKTENGKLVRRMFIPREGMLMGDCDYGQIEPRVLAHLSKDTNLCLLFNGNIDFHSYTAGRLGIERDAAKILNLSVGYRATFKSVSAQLRCEDREAQNEIDKWWELFPQLRRWQDKLIYDSKRSGYCTTLLGRRIRVDGLTEQNRWKREAAERQLINNITQGSAAEIMKKAMIGIDADCTYSNGFGLLVQVYDELLFESPAIDFDMAFVKEHMENALKLDVPLVVDGHTGNNWSECHG